MKKKTSILYALPLLLLACNNEATNDSVEKADSINEARRDRADSTGGYAADAQTTDFFVTAANSGLAEVRLGEMAAQRATNKKVKDMGKMLAEDHRAVNQELKGLARQRNVSLPDSVGDDKRKEIDKLGDKKGKDFDKSYINEMISSHERSVDLFQKQVDNGNDAAVKTFAANTLPRLQMHLDSLKSIKKAID